MNKIKFIKISIIILLICILISGILFAIIKNKEKKEIYINEYIAEDKPPEEYIPKKKFEQVKSDDVYFTIKKLISSTLTNMKQVNGIIGFEKYSDNEVAERGLELLKDVLDEIYIKSYNVNVDFIVDKTKKFTNYDLRIDKMYVSEVSAKIIYYLVYATVDEENFNILLKTDTENKTYSIFLQDFIEDKKISYDMNENEMDFDNTNIKRNNNNYFSYTRISDQYVVEAYMEDYKKLIFADIEKAYNMLDKKYREKRFGNIEEFSKYINSNAEELKNIEIERYLKNTYKDYTEYVGKDKYNNTYIFKSNYVMDYTVELDDYTIEYEQYDKEYEGLEVEEKVANNINKWVKMINHRDYKTAYNVLDESFRNNYFKTQDEFEEYMKRYFPSHYEIEFKDFSKEAGSIYTMDVTFKDISNKENEFNRTIIMKLKDSTDFVMSMDVFTT